MHAFDAGVQATASQGSNAFAQHPRRARVQVRDEAINAGFQLFKAKGLVPTNADSDSDDVNYAEAAGVEW